MPTWSDRIIVLLPNSKIIAGNNIWAGFGLDAGDDATFTNGLPLSSDGNAPSTHVIIDSAFTPDMTTQAKNALKNGGALQPGSSYYLTKDRELLEQYNGNLVLGQTVYMIDVMNEKGLIVVED